MSVALTAQPILCSNPNFENVAISGELEAALRRVIARGLLILGPEVEAFESEFAAFCEAKHAVGVANGTDAIELALRACGVQPGDEVLAPSHTAVATAVGIERAGAKPVFVDVDPTTRCVTVETLKKGLGSDTKAVVAVHLYGQPCPIHEILEWCGHEGLTLIEDCAQAHGARSNGSRVGTVGDAGAFSFYPTKNLGALGDGGAVLTSNESVAERIRELRQYGWKRRYVSDSQGVNSRLDELQAAFLRIKLARLEANNERRREIAREFTRRLFDLPVRLPFETSTDEHVFHLYVAEVENREALLAHLKDDGILAGIHYPMPIHLQPAYQNGRRAADLSVTERLANEVISLPIYPELSEDQQEMVIQSLRRFWEGKR